MIRKLYLPLAILLSFSFAPQFAGAADNLPPVVYGTDPYNYNYGKIRGDDPYQAQQPQATQQLQPQYQPQYQPEPQMQVQQAQPSPPAAEDPENIENQLKAKHKFALLVPLSGKGADIGKALRDAAKLAMAEKGSAEYALIPIDTNANGAADAAEKAVSYGVEVILGPVFSDDVTKVAKIARKNKIKVISFSNNRVIAGNGVYVFGMIPSQQVDRMLLFAGNRGIKNYSAIVPNNAYGSSVGEMTRKFAGWIGGKLYEVGLYSAKTAPSTAAGVISDAYKAKGAKPSFNDAIIIPEGGQKLKNVVAALSKAGLSCGRLRCLGVATWDDRSIISSPALNGAWYASVPYEDTEDFLARFEQKFRYMPDEIAALGYDLAALSIELSPNFSKESVENKQGFKGITGVYRFTNEGINQRSYAVYEIKNGIAHIIDSAGDRF